MLQSLLFLLGPLFGFLNFDFCFCQHARNTMDDLPYLGLDSGNVDVLVHFVGLKSEPCQIHNVNPNKFGVYCATNNFNSFAKELGLSACHPFIIWF